MTLGGPLAVTPALPLHEAGKYVAAAYIVLFAIVLVYVAIMALRLGRVERELGELLALSGRPENDPARGEGSGGDSNSGGEPGEQAPPVDRPRSPVRASSE